MHIELFQEQIKHVEGSRQGTKVHHSLFDVLFVTFCAVISGAKGWHDIREYELGHHDWLKGHELFKLGVPIDETFARII